MLLAKKHKAIVDAIADRDPKRARDAMMKHLLMVEAKMSQVLEAGGF